MASELQNKNQRTTTLTIRPDKQHPLDLKTLNSEPKRKSKAQQSRLQERQEREKLLQQHRLHRQERQKQQREREKAQKVSPTGELQELNQHTVHEQYAEASSRTKTVPNVLHEAEQSEVEINAHEHPEMKSIIHDHGSLDHNDEGDSISRNIESNHQRCTNCCGRLQVPIQQEFQIQKMEDILEGQVMHQCTLHHTNVLNEDKTHKQYGCRCLGEHKDHPCEMDVTIRPEFSTSQTLPLEQQPIVKDENEMRLRGGCGGSCGNEGGIRNLAYCPCGGCGGAACTTNTSCNSRPAPLGCCGGNQTRGLPCRCTCRSCRNPCPPCSTCGGQNCGKWNSCAGSGGGKCCFPRNTKRRNGSDCCGGGSGGCGSCGNCC